jgi:1-deoxy-D-xylulose-5-phosphate synthase
MVVHDVAIQKLPVIFCLDRAGLVGDDGPTHHGAYDIAYFRCIPNMIIAAPMNEKELRDMMYTAQLDENKLPFVIRYPRGEGVMPEWQTPFETMAVGKGEKIQEGEGVAILSIGHPGNFVVEACATLRAEGIVPAHFNMRFVKPLDADIMHEVGRRFKHVITIEDGTIVGGFGSACLEFFAEHHYTPSLKMLGIPDRLVEHGKPSELHRECGYDAAGVVDAVRALVRTEVLV